MIVINARFLTQEIRGVQRFAEQVCLALKRLRNDVIFVAPHNIKLHDSAKALDVQIIGRNTGHLWEQVDLPLYLLRHGRPLLQHGPGEPQHLLHRNVRETSDVLCRLTRTDPGLNVTRRQRRLHIHR